MFIKCSCKGHAVEIDRGDILENEWFLSVWFYGRQAKIMRWKERIRWIWRILRTGDPWADEIILNYTELKQLKEYVEKEMLEFEKRVS